MNVFYLYTIIIKENKVTLVKDFAIEIILYVCNIIGDNVLIEVFVVS